MWPSLCHINILLGMSVVLMTSLYSHACYFFVTIFIGFALKASLLCVGQNVFCAACVFCTGEYLSSVHCSCDSIVMSFLNITTSGL